MRINMSYEIIYKKAFIKVEDKNLPQINYVPVIQYGSNNCFDCVWRNGRTIEIPEKNWTTWAYTKTGQYKNQILFTRDQITELAVEISTPNTYGEVCHKTRNTRFEQKELFRWFDNGVKSAQSVEYYTELGNTLVFRVTKYGEERKEIVREYLKSTQQLIELAKKYQSNKDSNTYVSVGFEERELRLPKKSKSKSQRVKIENPYAIKIKGSFFYKLTRYGYKYSFYPTSAKVFAKKSEAEKYVQKILSFIYIRMPSDIEVIQLEGAYWNR